MGRASAASPSTRAPLWAASFPTWFLQLYRRPAALILILFVLPLLVVCAWLFLTNESQWRRREGEDLLVTARLASRILNEELDQTHHSAAALARRPEFRDAVRGRRRGDLAEALRWLADLTPMVDHVAVLDADGELLAEPPSVTASRTGAQPLRQPLERQPSVSGVYLRDPSSGEKVVTVSIPVIDDEGLLGAVQMQYRLEEVARWLDKVRIEPAGFVYVADQHGFLVTYPFQVMPGRPKQVGGWAPVNAETTPEGRVLRFRQGHPARPWTAAVVRVDPYGWRVVAQQPDAVMLKPFYELVGSFVLLVSLLAAFLGWLVLRWAHLHEATLGLLAKQARLLKLSEQARVAETMRKHQLKTRERPDAE